MSKIGYLLLLLVLPPLAAQTQQQALLVTRIYNITSGWAGECGTGGIDNRSNASRHNDYHSFYVTGTGTWSVTMQFSDASCTGPWTSFGSQAVITQASSVPVGWGFIYHAYISFAITGTVNITYSGWKNAWPPPGGGGGGGGGGITSINADTAGGQLLQVGSAGTDFAIVDAGGGVHTFNLPTASATARGALSSANWTTFNNKAGTVTCPANQVLIQTSTTGGVCSALAFGTLTGLVTTTQGGLGIDASGFNGVLYISGGVAGVVTGNASDCVKVDHTSGPCGSATTGITSINSDTTAAQGFVVGSSGSDFNIQHPGSGQHVFNLPTASASIRGALSSTDWSTFNGKAGTVTCPANQVLIATTTGGGTCVGVGFNTLSTGTNTTASMTVGTGATLTYTGTGVVNSNQYKGTTASGTGTCTSGQFVSALNDGAAPTCGVPTGSGNVTGPATSTQHALAAYADTSGRILENTAVIYDPSAKQLNLTGSTNPGKLTLYGSTSGSASVSVPAIAGSPADLLLPIASGTAGYVLSTNGGNPQQLSWIAASGAVSTVTGTPPIVSSGGVSPDISCPTCLTGGTPGYAGNSLVSGGGVAWTGGLNFTVSAATYQILGVQYSSALTNVTLSAADPAQDRIEVIYVDDTGTVSYLPGTPGTPPTKPQVDPSSQLELTWAYVAAGAGTPSNVGSTLVYDENAGTPTEWAATASGIGFALASTTNPYHLTKDIEATGVIATNYVQFQTGTPVNLSTVNSLVFYIRSKATWPTKKNLQISALSSGTQIGNTVTLSHGAFGFDSSVTAAYQQIVIPTTLFTTGSTTVNQFRLTVAGAGTSIGFYLDYILLQSGLPIPAGSWLTWKGTWSSAVAYNTNDVVIYSGTPYVALTASSNSTPPSANWAAMATIPSVASTSNVLKGNGSGAAVAVTGTATDCVHVDGSSAACGAGSVTTTGSPAAHQATVFSGASSITGIGPGALDTVFMGGGASADPSFVSVTNCGDGTHALAYSTSTHAFSCQAITAGTGTVTTTGTPAQYQVALFSGATSITGLTGASDQVLMGVTGTNPAFTSVNNCGSSTQALSYNTTTHAWGCQTISGSGVLPAWIHGTTLVGFSATPTFDASLSKTFEITLTGTVTSSTISNPQEDGQQLVMRICQDGTGGRPFAWPANVNAPMLIDASSCSQASKCSVQTINYRLSNTAWYAETPGVCNQ